MIWLKRSLDDLTILDVQEALVEGPILAASRSDDHRTCPVERATNAVLATAFLAAEDAIRSQFSRLSLGEVAQAALKTD